MWWQDEIGPPALAFVRTVCTVLALDSALEEQVSILRRNLLKLVHVREFAAAAHFKVRLPAFQQEMLWLLMHVTLASGMPGLCVQKVEPAAQFLVRLLVQSSQPNLSAEERPLQRNPSGWPWMQRLHVMPCILWEF